MLILFDNGVPAPLRHALKGHVIVEAYQRGWDRLLNGDLIAAAEAAGFDVLVTTDKNIRFQQNLKGRKIAFLVIGNQRWPPCAAMLRRSRRLWIGRLLAVTSKWRYRSRRDGYGACARV
jgi:hypothetical protein